LPTLWAGSSIAPGHRGASSRCRGGMMGGGGQEEALDETEAREQRRVTARQDELGRLGPGEVGAIKGGGARLEEHV
jgi:hypothetical protein